MATGLDNQATPALTAGEWTVLTDILVCGQNLILVTLSIKLVFKYYEYVQQNITTIKLETCKFFIDYQTQSICIFNSILITVS